jgi:trans-2,3-dihydro-3-hydroxyanthranilate isomerase
MTARSTRWSNKIAKILKTNTAYAASPPSGTGERGRTLQFYWVDVFAERPREGNQLAVFLDGEGLSQELMQEIAREMAISETTFLQKPEKGGSAKVRIFTTTREMPFAGHPTLGTAYVVAEIQKLSDMVVLEMGVGDIPVRLEQTSKGLELEMTQRDPQFGAVIEDRAAVARALGRSIEDLDPDLPVQIVNTGLPFVIVPLRSLDVAQNIRLYPEEKQKIPEAADLGLYTFTQETVGASTVHARPASAGREDPATGSAAGCLGSYLVKHNVAAPGSEVVIEQGVEILRPSRLVTKADKDGDKVVNIRVGGQVFVALKGELQL